MAGLKTISILFLVVLVALAGGSPVFAQPYMTLTPAEACPGARISVVAVFAGTSPGSPVFTSDPTGLDFDPFEEEQPFCHPDGDHRLNCDLLLKSASCDHYTITLTAEVNHDGARESVNAELDVAGSCCAVGGCAQPVNTLALLSPWIVAVALVGCIGTASVVVRKRRA